MKPYPMDKLEQKFKQDPYVQSGSTDDTTNDSPKSSRYKKGVSISDYVIKSQILSDSSAPANGRTSGGLSSRMNGNSGGKSYRQNYFPIETIKLMPIKIKDIADIFKNNSEYEVQTPRVVKMKVSDVEKMLAKQKQKKSSNRPHQIKDSLELVSNLSPTFTKGSSNNEQKTKPFLNEHRFKYQSPDHNNTRSLREPNDLQVFAIPHIAHTKAEPMVGNKSFRAKSRKKTPTNRSRKHKKTKRSQTPRNRSRKNRNKSRRNRNRSRKNGNRSKKNGNRSRRNRSKSRGKSGVRPMYSFLTDRDRSRHRRSKPGSGRGSKDRPRRGSRDRSRQGSRDRSRRGSRDRFRRGSRDRSRQGSRDRFRQGSRPRIGNGRSNRRPPSVCSSKIPPVTNKRKMGKPTHQLVPPGWTHLFETDEDCNPYPLCDNIYKPPPAMRMCPIKEPRDTECSDMMQEPEHFAKRRIKQDSECASSRPFLRNCDELLNTYCCDNDGKLQFIQPGLCSKKKYLWTNEYAIIPNAKVNLIDPCEDLDPLIYPRANNPCIRDGRGNPLTDCIGRPLRDQIGKKFLKFNPNGSVMAANFHGNFYSGQPPLCVKCPLPERSCAPDTTHNWWMGCGYPIQPDMSPFFKKVLRQENREWC